MEDVKMRAMKMLLSSATKSGAPSFPQIFLALVRLYVSSHEDLRTLTAYEKKKEF